jgi:hypothetical protein
MDNPVVPSPWQVTVVVWDLSTSCLVVTRRASRGDPPCVGPAHRARGDTRYLHHSLGLTPIVSSRPA